MRNSDAELDAATGLYLKRQGTGALQDASRSRGRSNYETPKVVRNQKPTK